MSPGIVRATHIVNAMPATMNEPINPEHCRLAFEILAEVRNLDADVQDEFDWTLTRRLVDRAKEANDPVVKAVLHLTPADIIDVYRTFVHKPELANRLSILGKKDTVSYKYVIIHTVGDTKDRYQLETGQLLGSLGFCMDAIKAVQPAIGAPICTLETDLKNGVCRFVLDGRTPQRFEVYEEAKAPPRQVVVTIVFKELPDHKGWTAEEVEFVMAQNIETAIRNRNLPGLHQFAFDNISQVKVV